MLTPAVAERPALPYGGLVLAEESRSTWENGANAVPLIADAERIKLVSDPLHAYRAQLYLQHQRPDLTGRLVRAADYRPGEWTLFKPFFAVYGLLALAAAKKNLTAVAPHRQ